MNDPAGTAGAGQQARPDRAMAGTAAQTAEAQAARTAHAGSAGAGAVPGPGRRPTPRTSRAGRRWRPAGGVIAALVIWALLTETGILNTKNIPTIPAVAAALGGSAADLLASVGVTLESLLLGLAIASVAGAVLGVAVGLSVWAEAGTDVIVRMMRPLPSLALIPIAILLAGLGLTMTSGLVAFASFWPVFINARYGTRQVEPGLLEAGRALGFGRWQLIGRVVVPSVAPAVATGIRVSVGIATVVTISVELVAGTGGLGGFVLTAQEGGNAPLMYAGIVVGGILGWLLNLAFSAASRRALRWEAGTANREAPS